ncbi:MAG: WG repeat-containing protein [Tannerella sp.]|jgi:hypothetical protein|nr:WG repeat-containing protein [Tannerella sp.]
MNKQNAITILISVSLAMFFACGQKYQGKLVPMLDNSTGKWGFADTLGKMIITPQWDTANDFSECMAVVGLNNKYGYIDETGIEIIQIKYDFTGNFSNDLALVSLNGKWGFIDKTGVEKISIKYDKAAPFSEGLAEVELDGKIGSIDTTGAIIVPFQYKELQYLLGAWGLSEIGLNTQPGDVFGLQNVGITFNDIKSSTLTFEKNDSFKSNINFSDLFDGELKASKSLKIDKNDSWKYENFVLGQQEKDNYIFSCDLILSPFSKETVYKLTLVDKDELRMEFYEAFNVASRQTEFGTTKSGIIHLQSVFKFKRL